MEFSILSMIVDGLIAVISQNTTLSKLWQFMFAEITSVTWLHLHKITVTTIQ